MSELIEYDLLQLPVAGSLAGVDEAGRGALAGPVFAACVASEKLDTLPYWADEVRDSKKLKATQRNRLCQNILDCEFLSASWSSVSAKSIDNKNVLRGTLLAMSKAINKNGLILNKIIIDGKQIPTKLIGDVCSLIAGDDKSFLIAAASIVAKQKRDNYMLAIHRRWPVYGFDKHKGYGTAEHFAAIEKYGPCPEHRLSFYPFVKKAVVSKLE